MISSMSIHDVVDIDVEDFVVNTTDGRTVAVTHYYFITKDGSKVDIAAFHAEEDESES